MGSPRGGDGWRWARCSRCCGGPAPTLPPTARAFHPIPSAAWAPTMTRTPGHSVLGHGGSATAAVSPGEQADPQGTALLAPGGLSRCWPEPCGCCITIWSLFHAFSSNPALCSLTPTQANLRYVPHFVFNPPSVVQGSFFRDGSCGSGTAPEVQSTEPRLFLHELNWKKPHLK